MSGTVRVNARCVLLAIALREALDRGLRWRSFTDEALHASRMLRREVRATEIVAGCGCVAFVDGSGKPCAEHHPDRRPSPIVATEALVEELEVEAHRCPGCGLVMSGREAAEQGSCNDCFGGAWSPSGEEADRGF